MPENRPGPARALPLGSRGAGFTLAEAIVAMGLTLGITAGFLQILRQGRASFRTEPELAAMRQDGEAVLDRIALDVARAGSGLPVEIPVFSDIGPAGNGSGTGGGAADGLDFLASPERVVEAAFEPVTAFDGRTVTLETPASRLARAPDENRALWVVVFNDDEMTPRWVFGRVRGVSAGGGGALGKITGSLPKPGGAGTPGGSAPKQTPPKQDTPNGARITIAPETGAWHHHFRATVDADTFSPGSGGGLLERGLQSLLGGVIETALPSAGTPIVSDLTGKAVGSMLRALSTEVGGSKGGKGKGGSGAGAGEGEGFGLFGLGRPGIVPVSRIRYWVREPRGGGADPRRVLMRRVDELPSQPAGFVEDLQVRYVTGANADTFLDEPPGFVGDMRTAAQLGAHIVRGVEIEIRVRSTAGTFPGSGLGGARGERFLTRTYRRRVGLAVAAAGVERRAWEEQMQLHSLPTEIPKIGPLRFVKLPW